MTPGQMNLLRTVADVLKAHLWFDKSGTAEGATRLHLAIDAAQSAEPPPNVVSDAEHFRRLNAGLRLEVSDLKGHVNILEGKLAAQSPAEPKPSVVSDDPWFVFCRAYEKSGSMMTGLQAALAAKDADTRTVIADNDAELAKIAELEAEIAKFQDDYGDRCIQITQQATEIERLKTELRLNIENANYWHDLYANGRRHNIEAAMERIRFRVTLEPNGAATALGFTTGTLTTDSRKRIVEAVLNVKEG